MSDTENASDNENTIIFDTKKVKLIQYMMLNRIVEKQSLLNVYKSLFHHDPHVKYLNDELTSINESLHGSKLLIRTAICEVSGEPFYILVSNHYIPGKIWPNSIYTDKQIDFIRCLVHHLVVSDSGTVSLDVCKEFECKLPKNDVSNFMHHLTSQKLFIQLEDETYAMSALLIAELEPYIQHVYKDVINECVFCKRVMFYGSRCDSCTKRGHFKCLKKYETSMNKGTIKCPSCNKTWKRSCSSSAAGNYEN